MKTNKDLLVKGIKYLAITVLLMFIGPTLLYFTLGKEHWTAYPLIFIGFGICGFAVYMGFLGIRTVVSSMFDASDN